MAQRENDAALIETFALPGGQSGGSDPGATISAPAEELAAMELHPLRVSEGAKAHDSGADFEIIGLLGSGGMGEVSLARQPALARDVAIKRPRGGSADAVRGLLREARVTGMLEHPSVVPVHAVGLDAEGRAAVVMKRIAGRVWSELPDETIDRHVEIAIQVANALHFAHSQGVFHRDVKTDNVMVGEFGEVYLLDWGIALDTRDKSAMVPGIVVGTPSQMAPEMTLADPGAVGPWTDVYLLGATLHHALVGRPRHDAAHVVTAIQQAVVSAPYDYPPGIPGALAAIVNRACNRLPDERFATARELAVALRAYLERRPARALVDAGNAALQAFDAALAGADLEAARRHYDEAAFAFRQARRIDPDDEDAQAGARRAAEQLFDKRVELRDASGAAALVDALDPGDAARRARLGELVEALARERKRLAELEHDRDPTVGRRERVLIVLVLAVLAVGITAYSVLSDPAPGGRDVPAAALLMFATVPFVTLVAGAVVFRKRVFANELSGALVVTLGLTIGTVVINRFVALYVAGVDRKSMALADVAILSLGLAAVAQRLPRLWPLVGVCVGAWLAVAVHPEWTRPILDGLAIIAPITVAWAWQRERRAR